tara:strand:+ start:42299 stop:42664 length:366 start_codon:yes stop_codon:yes gene_type:complete
MAKLPDFDTLLAMHREDPDALDRLRNKLTSELVASASSDTQRRLAGLQFRINMELRRAGNPTAAFLKLSNMMQDSFSELNFCLNNPIDAVKARQGGPKADILPLDSAARKQNDTPGTPTRH